MGCEMDESEFNQRVDEVIELIEDRLDNADLDIDYESSGGILTISFEDGSKVILNRQTPLKQIWVATKSGGFHFNFNPEVDAWLKDDDGTELFTALTRYCTEQSGGPVDLQG
jgi:CyaY protein